MDNKMVYFKALKFSFVKLFLGVGDIILSVIVLVFSLLIGRMIGGDVTIVMLLVWLCLTVFSTLVLLKTPGYLIQAGYVAIVTDTILSGESQNDQISYAVNTVKFRYPFAKNYFYIERIASKAVKELRRITTRPSKAPVQASAFSSFIKKICMYIAFNYVYQCCLCYSFCDTENSPSRAMMDGITIFFKNWRRLLKGYILTTISVIFSIILISVATFFILSSFLNVIIPPYSVFLSIVFAVFFALVIKYAFIDTWILVGMINSYISVISSTMISYDSYTKLCVFSHSFKELFIKSRPTAAQPVKNINNPVSLPSHPVGTNHESANVPLTRAFAPQSAAQIKSPASSANSRPLQNANDRTSTADDGIPQNVSFSQQRPVFCAGCGKKNPGNLKFCINCGNKLMK